MHRPINLMIIGAQKAGTTSLKNYLMQHPEICGHIHKEFIYFEDEEEHKKGYTEARLKYFRDESEKKKCIIAKHAALYSNEIALKKLKEHNPNVQLVLLLRNPVERTYSSFLMEYNHGSVKCPFHEIKNIIDNYKAGNKTWMYRLFVDLSIYHKHIETIYQHFSKKQVHIIIFDELIREPLGTCQNIFSLLGIDENFIPDTTKKYNITQKITSQTYAHMLETALHNHNPVKKMIKKFMHGDTSYYIGDFLRSINKSKSQHPSIDNDTKSYLIDFFKPYNKELEVFLNRDLSIWDG